MDFRRIPFTIYRMYLCKKWGLSSFMGTALAYQYCQDYYTRKLPLGKIRRIHGRGFPVSFWLECHLTDETYDKYMTVAEYYSMHPINGQFTTWIDDKLTLKYLCAGTPLNRYMPEYYFHLDREGNVLCLPDYPGEGATADLDAVAELLVQKGAFAIKLLDGTCGTGFYKGEYRDGKFMLNGEELSRESFCLRLKGLRNYIITEYLQPHPSFLHLCRNIPCSVRYVVGRVSGKMELLKSVLRIGTSRSGFVTNYNAGGVACHLDETGAFQGGNIMNETTRENELIDVHPDTGEMLSGSIPLWQEMADTAEAFGRFFPQLDYLGFDFMMTPDGGIKIIEINSLTDLCSYQEHVPVFETPAGVFFRELRKRKYGG